MVITDLIAKSFLFNLFKLARFSHAKKYLLKSFFQKRDPYSAYVLAKDKQRSLCIWALKQIKHRKEHFKDDLYFWEIGGERWLANLDQIHGLYECLNGMFHEIYQCECKDKTVLDIGGYIGDTARYFLNEGAKKVIIYEPVEKNIVCMRQNLQAFDTSIEIIPKALAEKNGKITLSSNYPGGHIGFGNRPGRYSIEVEAETFDSILSKTSADIAKIDCEGFEKYLLDVSQHQLQKIPYWMIECHDGRIAENLSAKFLFSGFEKLSAKAPPGHLSVYHFRLKMHANSA